MNVIHTVNSAVSQIRDIATKHNAYIIVHQKDEYHSEVEIYIEDDDVYIYSIDPFFRDLKDLKIPLYIVTNSHNFSTLYAQYPNCNAYIVVPSIYQADWEYQEQQYLLKQLDNVIEGVP